MSDPDTPRPAPVLDQINIVGADMEAMVGFYRRLGLEIPETDPSWDRHHRPIALPAGLDADLDSASFATVWNEGWPAGQGGVVIGFRVDSRDAVDALHADLTGAGYRSQQAPCDAFWGARYAVVEDPAGNAVGLMSPAEDGRRSTSPPPPD
jgi:catechol 2,3-dioxygenase-like lactoylglutathione lyase family enzyme